MAANPILPVEAADTLQPIIEEELHGEQAEEVPTEVEEWGADGHKSDCDLIWEQAQQDGKVIPFSRLVRTDEKAWRFRYIKKGDRGQQQP